MPDRIEGFKWICRGGLNSNANQLEMSDTAPGAATNLVNYEPSLFGGYRRVEGYAEFDVQSPYVGDETAEGPVLGVIYFKNDGIGNPYVIAARKDTGANTYSFWKHLPFAGWSRMGSSRPTTDGSLIVSKIRHVQGDFGDGGFTVFVDGVNPALIFDGLVFREITAAGTGGLTSPGGDQLIDAPHLVDMFENHLFLSGDRGSNTLIVHSAPNDPYTYTAAAGGGQLPVGYPIVAFKAFRDSLFIFGETDIKTIKPDGSAGFVLKPVTTNVGCIARDSVVEIGGDLMFLAPDGFRPVAGTSRIGDVELETISKPIQGRLVDLIRRFDMNLVNAVVIRSKSQVRFFFSDTAANPQNAVGIIGGLTQQENGIGWEFGDLLGIRASCTESVYINREEYVLHGDYDGRLFRQETGTTFDGRDITAIYATPYLDFGDTQVRKTFHKLNTFVRAEGTFIMNISVSYDWDDGNTAKPPSYTADLKGGTNSYGDPLSDYGSPTAQYGGSNKPVIVTDIQGSGYSARITYVTSGNYQPYSIQAAVLEFALSGRR